MSKSLIILGRQPALGLTELESIYGVSKVAPFGDQAALVNMEASEIHFARLGGAIKVCTVIATGDAIDFSRVQKLLTPRLPSFASLPDTGKITLGLSAYGLKVSKEKLFATGLTLKKQLRTNDRSVRLVPLTEAIHLNSAQVLHNKLLSESGREIVFVSDGRQTICAQTVNEQNLESYTRRDRGRPKRDARVGMLPPKLAQILTNLAVADTNPLYGDVILDPFCGTGVVLQEATLMGFDVYGSDLEPRMVEYTDKNMLWLLDQPENPVMSHGPDNHYYKLEQGDATTHRWSPMPHFVACETYLGRPFTSQPSAEILARTVSEVTLILKKFLQNIATQLPKGSRLCLAVPAWQTSKGHFKHLPLIDQLDDLGYNRVSFEHVRDTELIYFREDQFVARELLVITRK